MQTHSNASKSAARRHRPKTLTVFAAAFAAGAVLAYGVDRMVDVHVVRVEPQVESEPIFVALESMPQGSPVTLLDVGLKDWPKAMLPTTALKADASFEGMVLRHPIRKGQPLLSVQLVRDGGMLPGATVAAVPSAPGPANSQVPMPTTVPGGTIGESFVPATPAEPPATASTAVGQPPAVQPIDPAPLSPPAAEPAPVAAVVATPVADVVRPVDGSPAEPAAEPASRDEGAPIVAVVQPRSTDVDDAVVATADPPATAPTAVPTPASPEVAAAVPTPVAPPSPPPVFAPTPIAASDHLIQGPLAPPVPAMPPTDLERSLAGFAPAHAVPGNDRAAAGNVHAAPAGQQPTSVLDRTTEAEAPTRSQASPKLHLVVPERIALAVDASFTQPQPQTAAQTAPADQTGQAAPAGQAPPSAPPSGQAARAAAQTGSAARGKEPFRGGTGAATSPQGRALGRRPAAMNSAARKQPQAQTEEQAQPQAQSQPQPQPGSRQPATRPQPAQNRGLSAWLPTFLGGGNQQGGQSRQR